MNYILSAAILISLVGCVSLPKQVDREIRAHKLTTTQIIEIGKTYFEKNHSPLKLVEENTLIGEVISNHHKTRNTKVTIRLNAEDGRLFVQYSNIVIPGTYISRKHIDRMLGRYNRGINYALAAGPD